MHIQHPNFLAHLDAQAKTVWHPLHLPARLQQAFDVRNDIIALAAQYGEIEQDAEVLSLHVMLKSGIFVIYEVPKHEVEVPFALDLGPPQSAHAWANDELVFTMQWNARGVFQVNRFEKGPWIKQVHRAVSRPDLHLI